MDKKNYLQWPRGLSKKIRLGQSAGVEVELEARRGEPLFEEPDLRECMFERTLFDDGILASCVLPNAMHLIYGREVELLEVLRSLRVQAGESAEIWGGPQGRIWRRGFRYRPIATDEDLVASAETLLRMPIERGLAAHVTDYRWVFSLFHDEQGRRVEA